ncbi:RNA recognition motif domain [Cinara cedri]|uniref:RNA recognition motif domain n=1 Tax=Cinara cedri TaxID=506608 RepID=A0A5E4M8M3_9HEMI|nr:RNA recognition motif domain [Cinara cedri]
MDGSSEETVNGRRASFGGQQHNRGDNGCRRVYRGSKFRSDECGGKSEAGTRDRRPYRFSPYAKGDMNAPERGTLCNVQQIKKTSNALPDKNLKIHLSNINFRVTVGKIQDIFYKFGPLKSVDFHYDQCGKFLRTASVRFENSELKSFQEWYNVPFNDRRMKIKIDNLLNIMNYNLYLSRSATISERNTRGDVFYHPTFPPTSMAAPMCDEFSVELTSEDSVETITVVNPEVVSEIPGKFKNKRQPKTNYTLNLIVLWNSKITDYTCLYI